MPTKLNRKAYEQLIAEDIAWLELVAQNDTSERHHIIDVLKGSIEYYYSYPDRERRVKEAAKKLLKFKLEWTVDKERFPEFFKEGYEEGDEKCHFLSESILYLLFGKEDARTIIALVENVIREAGVDVNELHAEIYDEEQFDKNPIL